MSKQSEAKEKQGYVSKFEPDICGNCANLMFDMEFPEWIKEHNKNIIEGKRNYSFNKDGMYGDEHKQQKNLRCGIGGFSVKKQGSCEEWKSK